MIMFNPADIFWYWDPFYYRRNPYRTPSQFGFIESIFSVVFGDGDPNGPFEEQRWQAVSLHGVVLGAKLDALLS